MKISSSLFFLLLLTFSVFAQKAEDVLATVNGQSITVRNLSPEAQKIYAELSLSISETRQNLLSQMIAETLFESEAKTRNQTVEQTLNEIKAKIPAPSDQQIQAVYEANKAALGNRTLAESRAQIVAFLQREPEQKALQEYVERLRLKYKVTMLKDVNAANLKPLETLATVGGKTISVQEFEQKNQNALYELRAEAIERVKAELEEIVFTDVLAAEAKTLNLASSDLIAREVTDKMRDFSNEERINLQNALKNRLYAKYKVNFTLKEPIPVAQNISVDDDPAQGKANAPVTIVMFSDFQCPACGATHPILKRVIADFPGQVRFVVRDFPLTTIHENAFPAAIAANAANRQGKFFEYADVLYQNQNNLDRSSLLKYAADLGLNTRQFELDLKDEKLAAEVRKDMADGKIYGIGSTPTIYVNGIKIRQLTAENMRAAIEKALRK